MVTAIVLVVVMASSQEPPEIQQRVPDVLLKAFDEGGVEFLGQATAYADAVRPLGDLLDGPWRPSQVVEACVRLATVLEQTEIVAGSIDLTKVETAYVESTTLLQQRITTEEVRLQEERRVLELLQAKPERSLSAKQRAQLMVAEMVVNNTSPRKLSRLREMEGLLDEVRKSARDRNRLIAETAEFHYQLARVYRELADTIQLEQEVGALREIYEQMLPEATNLIRQLAQTREHMDRTLDSLNRFGGKDES